jgi:hypothetical protein
MNQRPICYEYNGIKAGDPVEVRDRRRDSWNISNTFIQTNGFCFTVKNKAGHQYVWEYMRAKQGTKHNDPKLDIYRQYETAMQVIEDNNLVPEFEGLLNES